VKYVTKLNDAINTHFVKPRLEQGLDSIQMFAEKYMGWLLERCYHLAVALKDGDEWSALYKKGIGSGTEVCKFPTFLLVFLFVDP
jgi:hypothetical protein